MKEKNKKLVLRSMTDIKIFMLFLLDNISYPVDNTTLMNIVIDNTGELILDYEEALRDLNKTGHIFFDEFDGEKYYMISELGKKVSSELYDTIDEEFRERSIKSTIKYIKLSEMGGSHSAVITKTENGRYKVELSLSNSEGNLMTTTLVVKSMAEAEKIKNAFDTKPDKVYKGILFSATGRLEYII